MRWQRFGVSPDGTHHVDERGAPAYSERFDEVLKFHAPGLAPVRRGDLAWHITAHGDPAYARRFARTFGYYEGLASVVDADGWHHVRVDGQDAYAQRYAWTGNVQGGRCPVREEDGSYLHIDEQGGAAYAARWRYAGDFREGVAVVQASDGRSTHIGPDGALIHGRWFVDLDVFHKGFARARDHGGWTHVDVHGRPLYGRRFSAVEPFYNGHARVERLDGGVEVIDETGKRLIELRSARRSEFAALSSDMVGFWRTEAIAAAVGAGVFEMLPGSTEDLASRLGLRVDRLGALLRGLTELSLLRRTGGTWSITERGKLLLAGDARSLADAAREYAGPMRRLWARLPEALREDAWHAPDVFGDVAADPDRVVAHHRMVRSYARHDYPLVPPALGLRGDERVLDVGGGLGVLAGLLLDHSPDLDVVLLDRVEVVVQVPPRPGLRAVAADFFEPLPLDADVAVLARVVHDWGDDDAVRILRNVRRALPKGGRVFLVEMLVDEDGTFGGLCDLHLLLATGGRERTAREYAALLDGAGFELGEVRAINALPSVLVGVAR
ncbi:MAG: methyltransferase domain-containing protein [Polyangiaceae bacterium]|nr:methyltransferase domain-containing protein [Polyangiaceae bacterium]